MSDGTVATRDGGAARQTTAVEVRIGDRVRLAARVDMTPAGLVAVGALVSMILLGSAAIIRAARSRS